MFFDTTNSVPSKKMGFQMIFKGIHSCKEMILEENVDTLKHTEEWSHRDNLPVSSALLPFSH